MRQVDVARLAAWPIGVRRYVRIRTSVTSRRGEPDLQAVRVAADVRGSGVRDGDCGLVPGPHVQEFELPARNRGPIVDHVVEVPPP
jgi:hypothetical protein